MPFKFWKREKPEKEKGVAEQKAKPEKAEAAPERKPGKGEEKAAGGSAVAAAKGEKASSTPAKLAEPSPAELETTLSEVHAGLVELGLTIPGTKNVFAKRVASFPDGPSAFLATYREKPYRVGTRVLADWLGFRASPELDPAKILGDMNLRLSSFKLSVQIGDVTWLDQELGLRKARLRLGDLEKVVRFKDPRDFVKSVNELLATRKLAFLELETWTSDFAFLLVRDPKWDKLAATTLVVVKAPQTAVGGECGECGAPVGANWHDCLSCGAVFGSE